MPSNTNQTLPANRRIKLRAEFDLVFRAKSLSNRWFAVSVRKNESGFARLGIAASKKIMHKAVSRNLAKRLVRETFRCGFPKGLALDVVVRAKRLINPENTAEGRQALMQLLQAVQA